MLNCFVVIMYSDLGTMRKLFGRVCISVKGSIGMYYQKKMIYTWIKESQKVSKSLVVMFVLSISISTYVMVMTRKRSFG